MFMFQGGSFESVLDGQVFDVKDSTDKEGQKVQMSKRSGKTNQRWKVVYEDKMEKESTKGLNAEFGMHIARPFYLVSRLPMKRVAECHGANNIWLKRYRKNVTAQ